ncbi:uncharacterized protein F5891DRAFT_1174257 [Suillus fuscotomentosus]|uniref:Fatty acid desaturase domain-containing protein n=1 Tax=Suillus fuscotomentosus TaxID=1912939 RepID=A0AAD4E2H3_9AGAM|nr:uncharacterized protein F5891DRAFT_1174257 [Suillus fuscotomentosus]KAG1898127.1 hypothetical protein F5891DRAFT_1174257 [Suillus fuscotomentosus]
MMFAPHQRWSIILSDIGIAGSIYTYGFWTVFRLYLVPYLWVNYWLVLITFLQHTDPLLPLPPCLRVYFPPWCSGYFGRNLLDGCGSIMGWIGAHATHGISETHVLHHVSSKIPHCMVLFLEGAPGGREKIYRVFKEYKFVKDESNILFYKSASGLAATRPAFTDDSASDSGIEIGEIEKR